MDELAGQRAKVLDGRRRLKRALEHLTGQYAQLSARLFVGSASDVGWLHDALVELERASTIAASASAVLLEEQDELAARERGVAVDALWAELEARKGSVE